MNIALGKYVMKNIIIILNPIFSCNKQMTKCK